MPASLNLTDSALIRSSTFTVVLEVFQTEKKKNLGDSAFQVTRDILFLKF